jgi:hypothetical protein
MKTLIILTISALSLAAQTTPKAKIVINVTDDAGVVYTSKITGVPASAGLDTLTQWMATQTTCDTAQPPVCTPKYANAAEFVKALLLSTVEPLVGKYPSAQTTADVAEITAKIAALEAKRKALFDAARGEK